MIVDMDILRELSPRLYRTVVKYHFNLRETSGQQEIDESRLSEFTRGELLDWLSAQPKPPAPVQPVEPQLDLDAEFKADLQRASDQARGLARLEQFCEEQGLQRCPANAEKVQQWIDQNLKGYWSQEGVDAAVLALKNELTWAPKTAPPPPPPPSPASKQEPTEVLADWQLPLDADERTMRKASTKALLDLNQRRRKATNQLYVRRSGSRGASF
jgi:hypothetical protein